MAAGVSGTLHDIEGIAGLTEGRTPKPGRPKTCKKNNSN